VGESTITIAASGRRAIVAQEPEALQSGRFRRSGRSPSEIAARAVSSTDRAKNRSVTGILAIGGAQIHLEKDARAVGEMIDRNTRAATDNRSARRQPVWLALERESRAIARSRQPLQTYFSPSPHRK